MSSLLHRHISLCKCFEILVQKYQLLSASLHSLAERDQTWEAKVAGHELVAVHS